MGSETWGTDVDADGTPNWRDVESDGDGAAGRQEGRADQDLDGVPDYLDRYVPEEPVEPDDDLGTLAEPSSGDIGAQIAVVQTFGGTATRREGGCNAGPTGVIGWWGLIPLLAGLWRRRSRHR